MDRLSFIQSSFSFNRILEPAMECLWNVCCDAPFIVQNNTEQKKHRTKAGLCTVDGPALAGSGWRLGFGEAFL